MTQKIILLLFVAALVAAQPHPRNGRYQSKMSAGAYHAVEGDDFQAMKKGGPFRDVQQSARFFYRSKTGQQLGDVIAIERQVVSGMNFKITFAADTDADSTQTVIISVYYQPWTKTIEVRNIMPPIDNVTDETGRILPEIDQVDQN